ncbi:MAG: UDP-N-acetylglucosamine 2-epimerase (non-hydrolyzing) [Butyrivibrio sp.]|nr:UDP-N-acetylglucosamine 2-epimerase (non-hydrolyzing) [Butyrivibrio sp.]
MKKILLVFGTRPEAIKMCPLVLELKKHDAFDVRVCLTGQHREMLRQVMEAFSVREDYNLDIMQAAQTLTQVTCGVISGMEDILVQAKPDIVLVHGDTTTSYAAALAAFYRQIPVGHVEAGLRSGNIYSPFPEEMNRLMTDRICVYHFAPTKGNRENLLREGVSEKGIFVTGNTVIDALATTVRKDYVFANHVLAAQSFGTCTMPRGAESHVVPDTGPASAASGGALRYIALTAHRRENLGGSMRAIFRAVRRIADAYDDVRIVYPVHMNPAVREPANEILGGHDRILLTDPIDVLDMHNLLARCHLVLTDSGGLQEEAPAFGKPVLVLRTETERPEAVDAGTVKVVGVEEEAVFAAAKKLLDDDSAYLAMAHAVNPYGDGHASERIAEALV